MVRTSLSWLATPRTTAQPGSPWTFGWRITSWSGAGSSSGSNSSSTPLWSATPQPEAAESDRDSVRVPGGTAEAPRDAAEVADSTPSVQAVLSGSDHDASARRGPQGPQGHRGRTGRVVAGRLRAREARSGP